MTTGPTPMTACGCRGGDRNEAPTTKTAVEEALDNAEPLEPRSFAEIMADVQPYVAELTEFARYTNDLAQRKADALSILDQLSDKLSDEVLTHSNEVKNAARLINHVNALNEAFRD